MKSKTSLLSQLAWFCRDRTKPRQWDARILSARLPPPTTWARAGTSTFWIGRAWVVGVLEGCGVLPVQPSALAIMGLLPDALHSPALPRSRGSD